MSVVIHCNGTLYWLDWPLMSLRWYVTVSCCVDPCANYVTPHGSSSSEYVITFHCCIMVCWQESYYFFLLDGEWSYPTAMQFLDFSFIHSDCMWLDHIAGEYPADPMPTVVPHVVCMWQYHMAIPLRWPCCQWFPGSNWMYVVVFHCHEISSWSCCHYWPPHSFRLYV